MSFLDSAGSPGVPIGELGCWGHRREVHSRATCSGPQDPSPSSFSNTAELSNCLFILHTESNFSQGKAGLNFQNMIHLSCFSFLSPPSLTPGQCKLKGNQDELPGAGIRSEEMLASGPLPAPTPVVLHTLSGSYYLPSEKGLWTRRSPHIVLLGNERGIIIQRKAPTENMKSEIKSAMRRGQASGSERSFENSLPRNSFATTWAGLEKSSCRELGGGKACEGALGKGQELLLLIKTGKGLFGGPARRLKTECLLTGEGSPPPSLTPPGIRSPRASPWLLPTLGRPA